MLSISVISLWVIAAIIVFSIGVIIYKKDNEKAKIINELINKGEYEEAIKIVKDNILKSNFDFIVIRNKIFLVSLELMLGNNDQAKRIIDTTKWGRYIIYMYYFKALYMLKEQRIDDAEKLLNKLKKTNIKNKNVFSDQIDALEKLVNYCRYKTEFEVISKFPLVKEIIENK